jgi:hypothetical protein
MSFWSYSSEAARVALAREDSFVCGCERKYRIRCSGEPELKTIGRLSYGSPARARSSRRLCHGSQASAETANSDEHDDVCFPVSDSSMSPQPQAIVVNFLKDCIHGLLEEFVVLARGKCRRRDSEGPLLSNLQIFQDVQAVPATVVPVIFWLRVVQHPQGFDATAAVVSSSSGSLSSGSWLSAGMCCHGSEQLLTYG